MPYAQRVAVALCSFIELYSYMHADHEQLASTQSQQQRSERADVAVDLAIELQRAILALVGTKRRRTYAHDLVYGMHTLYSLFAKPWNAATEANEHAHQDMKKYFRDLCSHSGPQGDCLQVLKMMTVKQYVCRTVAATRLPASNYAAMRASVLLERPSSTKRPHPLPAGVKSESKRYKGEGKMSSLKEKLTDQFVKE